MTSFTPDDGTSRFVLLKGNIADLAVSCGEEEFIQTAIHKAVGAGVAATLAMSGLAGAATDAMLSISNSADSVQFVTATVNGQRIFGRFSKVWFENGDTVEIVGEPQRDGAFAAYAVRCVKYRTLWMFPHCSRGTRAHWNFALKMVAIITATLVLLSVVFISLAELFSDEKSSINGILFAFGIFFVNSILIGFYFPVKFGRK